MKVSLFVNPVMIWPMYDWVSEDSVGLFQRYCVVVFTDIAVIVSYSSSVVLFFAHEMLLWLCISGTWMCQLLKSILQEKIMLMT